MLKKQHILHIRKELKALGPRFVMNTSRTKAYKEIIKHLEDTKNTVWVGDKKSKLYIYFWGKYHALVPGQKQLGLGFFFKKE